MTCLSQSEAKNRIRSRKINKFLTFDSISTSDDESDVLKRDTGATK